MRQREMCHRNVSSRVKIRQQRCVLMPIEAVARCFAAGNDAHLELPPRRIRVHSERHLRSVHRAAELVAYDVQLPIESILIRERIGELRYFHVAVRADSISAGDRRDRAVRRTHILSVIRLHDAEVSLARRHRGRLRKNGSCKNRWSQCRKKDQAHGFDTPSWGVRPEILTKDAVLGSSHLGTAHGLLYRNRLRSIAFAIAS